LSPFFRFFSFWRVFAVVSAFFFFVLRLMVVSCDCYINIVGRKTISRKLTFACLWDISLTMSGFFFIIF
jgi:hypothetical protein